MKNENKANLYQSELKIIFYLKLFITQPKRQTELVSTLKIF